jgi:hypothetical protein
MSFGGTAASIRTAAISPHLQVNQRPFAATREQPTVAFKAATLDRSVTPPGLIMRFRAVSNFARNDGRMSGGVGRARIRLNHAVQSANVAAFSAATLGAAALSRGLRRRVPRCSEWAVGSSGCCEAATYGERGPGQGRPEAVVQISPDPAPLLLVPGGAAPPASRVERRRRAGRHLVSRVCARTQARRSGEGSRTWPMAIIRPR